MKKFLSFFLILIMLCSLCGCSLRKSSFSTHEYMISALGFEEENEKIKVMFEAIIVNQEDTTAEKELKIIEGSGKTIYQAVDNANKKVSQPLMLSHCAVALIESGVSEKRFEEICDYCYSEPDITLSVMFAACDDVKKLLSSEAISSIAVGFDIISLIEHQSLRTGVIYKNRLYEIQSKKSKPFNTFALPRLQNTDKGYFLSGVTVFLDYTERSRLDSTSTQLYAILTDSQTQSEAFVTDKKTEIENLNVSYDFEFNNALEIKMTVDIKTSADEKNIQNKLKSMLIEEFNTSKKSGADIFAFGNLLEHFDKKIWNSVKNDYINFYKNSILTVKFK